MAILAAFAALATLPAAAAARPMQLDTSFGSNGRVVTPTDTEVEGELHIAEAANGDTLVAAKQALTAYLPSGQLDPSFGVGGTVSLLSTPGTRLRLGDLAVDSQGRPVVFGTLETVGDFAMPISYIGGEVDSSVATAMRFTPAGAPDPSFGSGGVLRTDLGLLYAERTAKPVAIATVGFVDSLDRPVFAAGRVQVVGCGHGSAIALSDMVVRLTSDGALDASFGGGDGIEPIADIAAITGLAPGRGGETMVSAAGPESCEEEVNGQVINLSADGAPKANFGVGGRRGLAGVGAAFRVAVDHHGRVLVLGSSRSASSSVMPVLRLLPSGRLDRSFGERGETNVKLPFSYSWLGLIANDRRDRVVLAGTLTSTDAGPSRSWLTAVRLTASGDLDRGFAKASRVATAFGAASNPIARDLLIDRRGRLVLAGANWNRRTKELGYGLVRYREGR